ncbi:hypothetical protein ACG59Z_00950 [Acinetobacter sp. ABJ_C1_1]|uniref:hypothetical protein n=1 Tax=Acinetobacter sp. ABJ_C1_1 TaxID=3378321 RepID=UPI0037DC8611
MVGPIDYRLDVMNPFQQAMQGFSQGTQIAANQQALAAQRVEEARKQQQYLAQQQQQKDMYEFSQNPNKTFGDFVNFTTRYPQLTDQYKKSWDMMNEGQRQQSLSTAAQVMSAIKAGSPDVAQDILEEQAKAYENSGQKESAFNMRRMKGLIQKDPANIYTTLGLFGSTVSPDEFAPMLEKMGSNERAEQMQPYQIGQISANTAKTVAETNDIPLAAEDRRTGVQNQSKKIEYDNQYNYDKLSQDQEQYFAGLDKSERIEAAKLKANKAETPVQRVERLEKVENYANASKQAADASNLAAKLVLQAKENGGAYWDRLIRNVPGTSENTFAKDIETLKSQVFLAQVEKMRGLGALTDKEGDAIRSSIASLDINQGPKAVQQNLSKIAQQMSAAAKSANRKAQLYATKGEGYSPAVMSAAKTLGISPAEAQKFVNENGL